MYKTLLNEIGSDSDYPERQARLAGFRKVLKGTIYDHIPLDFSQETDAYGNYIPIAKRRPSVRYNLCKTVVDDSVSMLFGDGHFPEIESEDESLDEALDKIAKDLKLPGLMIDAATRGSVGSVAMHFQVLKGKVFVKTLDTEFLTPSYDPFDPEALISVTEKYKLAGKDLRLAGWSIPKDKDAEKFWYRRDFTATGELVYVPWSVTEDEEFVPVIDKKRSTTHDLGFVPVVWVKNLPNGDDIDGACTFDQAIDTQIQIEYQLSQAGRGLKYSAEPTLLLKNPADPEGTMVKGAGNAIVVGPEGDAKLLEINGTATSASLEYVARLREYALEVLHGNRSSADKLSAAQSGRALELLHQALIWLTDKLRISYGDGGLLELYKMIVKASQIMPIVIGKETYKDLPDSEISLRWPKWAPSTAADKQAEAIALDTLTKAGILSKQTATRVIAVDYGIEDPVAEAAMATQEAETAAATEMKITANVSNNANGSKAPADAEI
jgi:hypothetical protein